MDSPNKKVRHIIFLAILLTSTKCFADTPTVVPNVFNEGAVCYRHDDGKDRCEGFLAPTVKDGFGESDYLTISPRDASRLIQNLPTFGLAAFHQWLFGGDMLQRAQRQFAECVGQIKMSQELLGMSPLIDEPSHPLYTWVISVREYTVPFNPVQNIDDHFAPPKLSDMKLHVQAALDSYNITVANLQSCRAMQADMKAAVKKQMKKPKRKR